MTSLRLFQIELRRNAGLWLVPLIVLVSWYLLDTQIWTTFLWAETNELLQKSVVPFAGPAVAGLAAWMAGRDRRRGMDDLLATTPRSQPRRRLTLLAATATWGLVAYALFATYMLGRTALEATWGGPALWPIAIVLAAMLAQAAWGFLAGSLVPSRFTAPLTAIAALGLQQFAANDMRDFADGSRGSTWLNYLAAHNLAPNLAHWQTLFYLGLAGAALAAITLRSRADVTRWAVIAGFMATAFAGGLMVWGGIPRWDPTGAVIRDGWGRPVPITMPVAPEPVCKGAPVTVCVHPAYQPVLDAGVLEANRLVAPLLGLPGVPLRVERGEAGLSSRRGGTRLDLTQFADKLVAAPGSRRDGYIENEAQLAIRSWLLRQAGWDWESECHIHPGAPGWPTPRTCEATERFARHTPAEQRAWLEANYAELRAGALTLDDLP